MSELNSEGLNNKRKKFRPRKRKQKLTLVFDENARREFLTGFHKRKLQRKNKAKEEFEKQLKAERKRIKAEAKEQYMKLILSRKSVPQLNDLMAKDIDMGTHSVSITELSTADLARKNNWIGINDVHGHYMVQESEELNEPDNESTSEELEGMEVIKKYKILSKSPKQSSRSVAKSCKDVRRKIKQQATASVKNSKIFKKKAVLEKVKNIKLKRKHERKLEKIKKVSKRNKHKNTSSKYNF